MAQGKTHVKIYFDLSCCFSTTNKYSYYV